jgi:xanthine dehydrogenase accessory factor
LKRAILDQLCSERAARRPAVLATWLESGRQQLFLAGAGDAGSAELAPLVRRAFSEQVAQLSALVSETVFVQSFQPPLRLFLVGAVHIAQHLVPMAQRAGYAVCVIDPRRAFASEARFPRVEIRRDWPDAALAAAALDARSAVVTLSHDPKLDDPALRLALASPAFYVGALGSRASQAARRARLRAVGCDADALSRIHGPVGLDIGARSPAEIAVSILAQMTRCLRRPAS